MDWKTTDSIQLVESGLVALRGFWPKKVVAPVREKVMSELERVKIRQNGKWVAGKLDAMPVFQRSGALSQMVSVGPEFKRLFDQELREVLNLAADGPLLPQTPTPQLLLSLPNKEAWHVPTMNWHLDLKVPHDFSSPGLQAFVLIDDLVPRGGATLAIAGSHRLHELAREGGAHHILRQHAQLSALYDARRATELEVGKTYDVNGIPVAIQEMSGRAGDVFVMDLRVLHSPSLNASKNVRMMGTNRYLR
ncbi:MAG: hypothetical protein KF767_13265 [Bdellovibrionaceae bacterium]|nr:hypothetical protein [Pseudobdellovibrionaceae bacterium]